jgi:hypothetical protein
LVARILWLEQTFVLSPKRDAQRARLGLSRGLAVRPLDQLLKNIIACPHFANLILALSCCPMLRSYPLSKLCLHNQIFFNQQQ